MSKSWFFVDTEGDCPEFQPVELSDTRYNGTQLDLKAGDSSIAMRFETCEQLIAFCDKHNIPYTDERGQGDE